MNYKNKYLKYKIKYLYEKNKQKGGNKIELKLLNDITYYNTNDSLKFLENKILYVPMNAYEIVNNESEEILLTSGVTDCVVIIIFNPTHGRYLAHFSRDNEFSEEYTNACELMDEEDKDICDTKSHKYKCDIISRKINDTFPLWINNEDTCIHLISQSDNFTLLARYIQIIKKYDKPTINIYLVTPQTYIPDEEDDIGTINFYKNTNLEKCKIELDLIKKIFNPAEDFINKWNLQNSDFFEIFGIKKDGSIFVSKKENLQENISKRVNSINLIKTTHSNERCVIKMSKEI